MKLLGLALALILVDAQVQAEEETTEIVTLTEAAALLTKTKVAEIENVIKEDLKMAPGYGLNCDPCYLGDLYGVIVRLVFHDAVGQQSRLNGCTDLNDPDNNGLNDIIVPLTAIWSKIGGAEIISFADFTAIAAKVAVEMSSTISPQGDPEKPSEYDLVNSPLILPLKFGRLDQLSCNDEGSFPAPSFTWAESAKLFNDKFGLNEVETVALMGAHALGRAEIKNSGTSDQGWTEYQSSFANRYFTDMYELNWRVSDDNNNVFKTNNEKLMLLVSDTEMIISPAANCVDWNSGPEEKEGACPLNVPILPVVKSFGGKGGLFLWWKHFEAAFTKMVEANNPGLYAAL